MILLNNQLNAHIERHGNSTENSNAFDNQKGAKDEISAVDEILQYSFKNILLFFSKRLYENQNEKMKIKTLLKYACYVYTMLKLLLISSFNLGLSLLLVVPIGYWLSVDETCQDTVKHEQLHVEDDFHLLSELQAILGAAQIPPIDILSHKRASSNHRLNEKIIEFAKSQSELLGHVDIAVSRLRILCSQQYGLGSYSPSLERVENSSYLCSSIGYNVTINTSKRVLYDCLKVQLNSLRRIMQDFHLNAKDDRCFEMFDSIQEHYDMDTTILTISTLKKCRQLNSTLCSNVLSKIVSDSRSDKSAIFSMIQMSVTCSRNLGVYLRSYFNFYSQRNNANSSTEIKQLNGFQRQMHGIQVAIWSFSQYIMQKEYQNEIFIHDELEEELFQRITTMFEAILAEYSLLSHTLFPKAYDRNISHTECLVERTQKEIQKEDSAAHVYDDGHSYDEPNPRDENKSYREMKTLVYSGKGLKTRKTITVSSKTNPNDISEMPYFRERIKLLNELQSRLKSMDLSQEIDATISDDSSSIIPKSSTNDSQSLKTDNIMKRYPPDSFLSDLIGAVSKGFPTI